MFAALLLVALSACADPGRSVTPVPLATPPPATQDAPTSGSGEPAPQAARLIAAGDIAACDRDGDAQTASLVAGLDGTVATLGDHVYPSGTGQTYAECYDPVWGAFLERTRPSIGNHDLEADGGAAYHAYFGERAGTPGEGWYSYDLEAWHLVGLNTNCEVVDCAAGSPQHAWLSADLAASDAACVLAYGHHPRFSSGPHSDYAAMAPLWDALSADGAELLLAGHDHLYERFAPQAPDGAPDPAGIRQFTVGTGGYEPYAAVRVAPNSELIIGDAFGVLELTLRADAYDWRFITIDGAVADAGTGACH